MTFRATLTSLLSCLAILTIAGCATNQYVIEKEFVGDCKNRMGKCYAQDTTTPKEITGICAFSKAGWSYRTNNYLIQGNNTHVYSPSSRLPPAPRYAGRNKCTYPTYKKSLVEGEYALSMDGLITFKGDLCRDDLTLYVNRHHWDLMMQGKLERSIKFTKGASKESAESFWDANDRRVLLNPVQPFYLSDTDLNWVQPNWVQLHLLAAARAVHKSCGGVPEKIKIVGRWLNKAKKNWGGLYEGGEYSPKTIYTGTLIPRGQKKIIHDNKKMEKVFVDWEWNRRNEELTSIMERNHRMQIKRERAQMGALLLILGAMGMHDASPCNDANSKATERPVGCNPSFSYQE